MNSVIISTTNNLEGWNIKNYFAPISANVVIGANIFSDISASFTDFFGGRSNTYEQKLQEMYKEVMDKLIEQAESVGANSIVGLKVDFGEISGKGNQMFMLSAVGTPTFVVEEESNSRTTDIEAQSVNGTLVENKLKAKRLIEEFANGSLSDSTVKNNINFIVKSRMLGFSDLVVAYIKDNNATTEQVEIITKISKFFKTLDKDDAVRIIYNVLSEKLDSAICRRFIYLIKEFDLIDYEQVSELLRSSEIEVKKSATQILALPKSLYTDSDIKHLINLKQTILACFPTTSENVTSKGFLTSARAGWRCVCGLTNDLDTVYCADCKIDQKGFYRHEKNPDEILQLIEDKLVFIEEIRMEA